MLPELNEYLERVRHHLDLSPETERLIMLELRSHFEDKAQELQAAGLSEQEAVKSAIDSFGRPRSVARLLYEAHHRVTWPEVGLAVLPHLMIAFLFAVGGWDSWFLAPFLLIPIVVVTLYGWWQGKPGWLYPWVGYSLVPLIITGYLALPILGQVVDMVLSRGPVPNTLTLAAWVLYLPVAAWIIGSTTIKVARRNWMLASFMLFPLPVVVAWLILLERVGGLFNARGTAVHGPDGTMALVHIILALTTVVFIRLRGGALKVGALMVVAFVMFTAILRSEDTGIGLFSTVLAAILIFAFFLSPAVLGSVADRWEAPRRRGAG
ncbi:MAG: permease prefix domain 1-containing protein [Dehalococcoidia bacterium]